LNSLISILLLEDNPADAYLIEAYLEEAELPNYALCHLERMSEAIKLRQSGYAPQVLLLDMTLPDITGMETVKKATEIFATQTAIIVLTGLESDGLREQIRQLGAHDYLNKDTLTATELRQIILQYLIA
jgi:sigma-B regulation protein RsbU (phosphoserine phosphatase)